MAVGKNSSNAGSLTRRCHCFKVANLKETILDASETSELKDRYVLGDQLGWGQFGVIRACADKFTGELLACKSIAKDRLVTQDDVRSVKLEIEIMSKLSGHPHVVDLKAVYEEEDYVHLVMELCAGGELFHRLEKQGRYCESQAKVIFRHLMQVVLYCHDNGVVHRDLKPENVLLATKSSSSPIKLADFGLATYIKPGESLHGTVGSPFYIAPEVLSGGYTQAADVWSAGVILYILLSSMPPFWGKTKSRIFDAVRAADLRFPSELWDRISEPAKELIRKMLCVDPLKRLTAEQVLAHSWMEEVTVATEESHEHDLACSEHIKTRDSSFSASCISRDHDISFGTGSAVNCEPQSPTFTCRSSFSAFMAEPSTPTLISAGFSFRSSGDFTALEFVSPIPSLPSFTFFSPRSVDEHGNQNKVFSSNRENTDEIHTGADLEKRFESPHSSLCSGTDARDLKEKSADSKRSGGTGVRILGIHNKRNRTIGLGEFNQLDIVVTESVIRWASCTHLPTASSLRSSLVC
ncbi:calcium-dependent protein kinase 10 isoform X2 [Beta vulgaris subsp. vulgaris]|uniref:calcium-dependent protein kinase 10 isoform X2 n=1 Tax=Beta vulgaris subsp. vulgaris TaxID=3555 RepID=UPI002036C145|nr:calcium-dependent protein kinase 10 isoform X2 [Beta vulgaris subsp. vulgaris]